MLSDYNYVGTIVGTHALKGEVKIYSVTDFKASRYAIGNTLYIDYQGKLVPVVVKSHREHKGFDLVSFEGHPSINEVEKYVKSKIYVAHSQLEELPEDEYYYFQLMGCSVRTTDDVIGIVKDIVNYGASDILVVKNDQGKEYMIPFVDDFIVDVDLDAQMITVQVIEGLLGD